MAVQNNNHNINQNEKAQQYNIQTHINHKSNCENYTQMVATQETKIHREPPLHLHPRAVGCKLWGEENIDIGIANISPQALSNDESKRTRMHTFKADIKINLRG